MEDEKFSHCCQRAIIKDGERMRCSGCFYDATGVDRQEAIKLLKEEISKYERSIVRLKAKLYHIEDGGNPQYSDD